MDRTLLHSGCPPLERIVFGSGCRIMSELSANRKVGPLRIEFRPSSGLPVVWERSGTKLNFLDNGHQYSCCQNEMNHDRRAPELSARADDGSRRGESVHLEVTRQTAVLWRC